ncbi:MAG: [protein-PII] uridylyltransferase [Proteobacteria bacterium]|nr:[protein-PII] uridylyltransferase [Pseudomonadota bacterium]
MPAENLKLKSVAQKPPRTIRTTKDILKMRRTALQNMWRKGLSGRELLRHHTGFIDACLTDCLAKCSDQGRGLALVALGGYGRSELFPFSDIDIMLLHEPKLKKEILAAAVETTLYPLWDAGFEVGHGVRSPKDCITDSKKDFFLQSAMLDARLIAGSRDLFEEMNELFREKFIKGNRQKYLREVTSSRSERYKNYGLDGHLLEPNIKECRGGFRDIQTMQWTAQIMFGLKNPDSMEQAGLFTSKELLKLETAQDYLIKIRNRLHYISGRKNDTLYFEHQEEIARAMGFTASKNILGVEYFMKELYTHLHNVSIINELFFEHVDETTNRSIFPRLNKALDENLEIRHDRIHLIDLKNLQKRPVKSMQIFAQSAKTGLPIHYRTRKAIYANLGLIDEKTRSSRHMAKYFIEALQGTVNPMTTLTSLLETGLLTAYIPEFKHIESLAQHDVYHTLTVDRHLLRSVAELQSIIQEQESIFTAIKHPHVLYLATIFHDIGKGQGLDHEKRGAEMVKIIGARLGLPKQELEKLIFLVRHHLFLCHMAMRRDLEDEKFIIQCAEQIKDIDNLNMLYLLSIADSRATGPAAWNDWKAALLQELYLKIANTLDHADLTGPDHSKAADWMRTQITQKAGGNFNVENLPDDYLLNFSPDEITSHIDSLRYLNPEHPALIKATEKEGHWSLLIISHDQTGLLSKICGTLALHNLDVLGAHIHTWQDGTVVDVLEVRPLFETEFQTQDWQQVSRDLNLALLNRLSLAHRLAAKRKSKKSEPGPEHRHSTPKVLFDNNISEHCTVIEVYARDQSALLYNITRSIADFGINICRAMISTRHEQMVDVFYVQDNGEKITEKNYQEEIRQALFFATSSGIEN